jgi:hypothetical protein
MALIIAEIESLQKGVEQYPGLWNTDSTAAKIERLTLINHKLAVLHTQTPEYGG